MHYRIISVTGAIGALLWVAGATACAPDVDLAAESRAIHAVDSMMVASLNERDLDTWLSQLEDSASMLPPNNPPVTGKTAIRAMLSELMATPSFRVTHHPGIVEVAQGGDLAYIRYAFELTISATGGATITERGKDLSVFRKQPDGSWKLLFDMWSSDESPAPPAGN